MKISCTLERGTGYKNKDEPLPAPKLPRQVAGGRVAWGMHSWVDLVMSREAGLVRWLRESALLRPSCEV